MDTKYVFVLVVTILSICAGTDGIGCPEPVVDKAQIEFSASPGEDGLYPRDTVISVQCSMGATMEGNRFVSCLETDAWDTLPTCTRKTGFIKCPTPPELWNGNIKRISGRWAKVSCNTGFTLLGRHKIKCAMTAEGVPQWPLTLCRASVQCNNPGNITDGDWSLVSHDRRSSKTSSQFSPNTKISITCSPGFVLVGKPQVICGMDGSWNTTIPTCEEIRCSPLNENIPHGNSEMMNRTYKQGDVVDYFCDTGYRIFGSTTRVCSLHSSGGTWSHLNPVCEEIVCLRPSRLQYGDFYLESNSIGGKVTFYCRSGYQIRGSEVRHCLPSGKWSGKLTSCNHDSFYCPNPGVPMGGYMENQDTANFQKGGVVRYACQSTRALVGSAERHCNTSGSWSGEEPKCRGPFDFDDINEVAVKMGYVADSIAIDTSTNTTSRSRGRSIDLTYTGGYDIYFAFDASGSITKPHFETFLDFAKILVEKIGVNTARYAAFAYATRTLSSLLISDEQNVVNYVLDRIDSLADLRGNDDREIGTGTATGKALKFIHEDMIPLSERHPHRPNAKKVLFLFSDGRTNEGASDSNPKKQAEILREDYEVQIHCIGVTDKVDISELQAIASKPSSEHLFIIADYRDLNLLVKKITQQIDHRETNLQGQITAEQLEYAKCGCSNCNLQGAVRPKGRIADGDDATLYRWPWQVAIYIKKHGQEKVFICGGTLIAPNWVLTAAHCLKEKWPWKVIRVYTGVTDRSLIQADTTVYEVDGEDALIRHANFSRKGFLANDIALLKLRGYSPLSPKVRTICVPQEDMTDEFLYLSDGDLDLPYVTGWGVTKPYEISFKKNSKNCDHTTKNTPTNLLQQLQIPLVTNEDCKASLEKKGAYLCSIVHDFNEDVQFCAGYLRGGQDACEGDSGGPIMRELVMSDGSTRWVQIGIVSWGEGCAQEGRYGFYTRLSRYIGWIQQHVGNSTLINKF